MYKNFWREQIAHGLNSAGSFINFLLLGFDYLCLGLTVVAVADVLIL
jgi:hypothetical protein